MVKKTSKEPPAKEENRKTEKIVSIKTENLTSYHSKALLKEV